MILKLDNEAHYNQKAYDCTHMQDGASVHEHDVHMIMPIEKVVGLKYVIPNEFKITFLLSLIPHLMIYGEFQNK